MGKITYSLYLRTRPTANGLYNLTVRRTENRKHKFVENIVQLRYNKRKKADSEWDNKKKEVINRKDADELNNHCWHRLNHYKGLGEQQWESSDFMRFANKHMMDLDALGQYSKSKRVGTVIGHIKSFAGKGKSIRFSDMDLNWTKQFKIYLSNKINPRGEKPSDNTICNYLDTLRQICADAIDEGFYKGVNPFKADPIRKLIPKRNPGLAKRLITEELWKLLNIQVDTVGLTKEMYEAAMVFYFQFSSNGMRIGDAMGLKWKNFAKAGIELLNDKGEKYQTISYNDKNLACLRWFIDYENNYKVWDWSEKKFSWEKEVFVDFRLESKLLSLDGEYYDALRDIADYREQILFNTPAYHLSDKPEYEVEMEIVKQVPVGLKQRLHKVEEKRNMEILRVILRDINTTSRENEYVFPHMRQYPPTLDRKVIKQRKDSCAARVNKQLKKVAGLLQITKFSTHWNRHSLAQKLADENVDIHVIKELFNHSTYKVTENYMKSFKAKTDGVYDKVFKDLNL